MSEEKRVCYFDAFNGVSGDMILGALVDLGVPLAYLEEVLAGLPLPPFRLEARTVSRHGIRGTDFRVLEGESHRHGADHHHGRHYREIRHWIEQASSLDEGVRRCSLAILRRLAEAEAKVHGCDVEEVHFHEVGATDTVVDIVGCCAGFHYLKVEEFYCSALRLGGGEVRFSHGSWPVPAPATAELVRGFPVELGPVQRELTTPTGAAIVTTLVRAPQAPLPPLRFEVWGWGAGDQELEEIPNFLRLGVGTSHRPGAALLPGEEEVWLLEANVDDMDGEGLGYFLERLLQEGALDVFFTPIQMKKSRPGILLSALCRPEQKALLSRIFFQETTTLGVRMLPVRRCCLEREIQQVQTSLGVVKVKLGRWGGRVLNVAPEFEELKRIAQEKGLPLKVVRQKILQELTDQAYVHEDFLSDHTLD